MTRGTQSAVDDPVVVRSPGAKPLPIHSIENLLVQEKKEAMSLFARLPLTPNRRINYKICLLFESLADHRLLRDPPPPIPKIHSYPRVRLREDPCYRAIC